MPAAKTHRLTPEDHQHIIAYTRAGFTTVEIAHALRCSRDQVCIYLGKFSPRLLPDPLVPIVRSQYVLIQRFEASTLHVEDLATALGVDPLLLVLELRGRKTMSFKRIKALNAVFAAQVPVS